MALGGGFFPKAQDKPSTRLDTGKPATCASCGLYQQVHSPRMAPFGNFRLGILNIGEAPGAEEDRRGRQWQGKVGQRLQREYKALGVDLFEDCLNINAVNCRPTEGNANRTPTGKEIQCCRVRVMKVIEEYQPKVIVLVGDKAVESIIGSLWKKDLGGIAKWRGFTIPDRTLKAWICPVWHPSYIERQQGMPEIETVWRADLKQALSMALVPFPEYENEEEQISIVEGERLEQVLTKLYRNKYPFAFDYETTGRKPHADGHAIVCASICFSEDKAYAFEMPREGKALRLWRKILEDPTIPKQAYNMKFEHAWSLVQLGIEVQGWDWDGMLAAHILDNRAGICSLKYQTYVNFGVAGYDEDVASYLKSDDKDGNALNHIFDLWKDPSGREKLLTYCGMDSLFTYRLGVMQKGWLR